jgi:protein AFG1
MSVMLKFVSESMNLSPVLHVRLGRVLHVRTPIWLIGRRNLSADHAFFGKNRDAINSPVVAFVENRMSDMDNGSLLYDAQQLQVAASLDALRQQLVKSDKDVLLPDQLTANLFSDAKPRGIFGKLYFKVKETIGAIVRRNTTPKGIYIHGSVGSGKSFLMDVFWRTILDGGGNQDGSSSNIMGRRKIVRWHFHEFMMEVHSRIHQFNQQRSKYIGQADNRQTDPIAAVALSFAQEARVLCLDEFQVTDIADAMILKRLFTVLWGDGSRIGMVVVATSNRHPNDLYEGGLNRSLFVPFIDTLRRNMEIIELNGKLDYRRRSLMTGKALGDEKRSILHCSSIQPTIDQSSPSNVKNTLLLRDNHQSYFYPANSKDARSSIEEIFLGEFGDHGKERLQHHTTLIPVRMGRHVVVPRSNQNGNVAWFEFEALCGQPLGAADYWAICEHYSTVIVDHVPQLDASKVNEARRFVTLIDALYESRTRLVLVAQVPLDKLLIHFEATVETKDGDEEIAKPLLRLKHPDQDSANSHRTAPIVSERDEIMFVEGKGGSSSSSATTMIRTTDGGSMEWSATGRIGVSLAQLSTVREVSFSFQRAESRLVEMMNRTDWGR